LDVRLGNWVGHFAEAKMHQRFLESGLFDCPAGLELLQIIAVFRRDWRNKPADVTAHW
jgi:hypothetical protein